MPEDNIKQELAEQNANDGLSREPEQGANRREFLQRSLAAASGLALSAALPGTLSDAQTCPDPKLNPPLQEIGKITPSGNTTQVVMKVMNEPKAYLSPSANTGTVSVCSSGELRFFHGQNPNNPKEVWPTPALKGQPAPGPTLRAKVGGRVEVTLMNHVDATKLPATYDTEEKGKGCNTLVTTAGQTLYPFIGNPPNPPGAPFDVMPDCFHGSSTANLHFHGLHVSPSNVGDNILVYIRPSPRPLGKPPIVDEAFLKANSFGDIFKMCEAGHVPQRWENLPPKWREAQQKLLEESAEHLWPENAKEIHNGLWPSYYIGAYANYFQIPTWDGKLNPQGQPTSMGQAPGTHWYHSHKHGSVALNLANGMAGALIVEGDYDKDLAPYFDSEKVLVFQQFGSQVNLLRPLGTNIADAVFLNGQFTPQITMAPGEIQLWRIVNACHQKALPLDAAPTGLKWVATAHDGVQLAQDNYADALPTPGAAQKILAPGNRLDLLVQAPTSGGPFTVTSGKVPLFTVNVSGTLAGQPKQFPKKEEFPTLPGFLVDIPAEDVRVWRELRFKTAPKAGRDANNVPPAHTINGKLFSGDIDQSMTLGAIEEWKITNEGGPAHPFHIHVNPFQVVEIMDPTNSIVPAGVPQPLKIEKNAVWWDNFPLPPVSKDGKTPGYIKIRHRFFDYTGMYVLHCHILGHEDRGMMELVQVVNKPGVSHH
jgi:FtsP/CotA-like multicopper oxidase with cupredoxin domain